MSSPAPPSAPEQDQVRAPIGEETTPVAAPASDPVLDSFSLLDHRARRRAVRDRVAPAGHYLALHDGAETWLLRLESTITHVGRGLTADVRFDDLRISRTHAIVARHGRHARLLDNRSANGTFLNGRRVLAADLRHGDVIGLGPVALQYLEIR